MTGSTVLKGSRTSSTLPVIHPETVTIRFTRLLLFSGRYSNVLTDPVLLLAARPPMRLPDAAAVEVMMAAPPAPARKPPAAVLPLPTMVASPAARPMPMAGASRPADKPMTRPPPTVASPIIM